MKVKSSKIAYTLLSIDEKTKKDLSSTMYELISEEKKEIK